MKDMQPMINALMQYLQYAYYCRLRFKPDLAGEVTIRFIITIDGKARNIEFPESTLNDKILEYTIARIIRKANFGTTNGKEGATAVTQKCSFLFQGK
jgi:outer membrane biosynthesis protein TonB